MESSTIQPSNKGPSLNIILIVIVIGVIIFFVFLNKPSQPTTTMIPTTTMMPITTRIPTTIFNYPLSGTEIWGGENNDEYQCPGAKGRDTTSNQGGFGGYCIFRNEDDAKNYCNSDPTCVGYVTNNAGTVYQLTRKPKNTPGVTDRKFYKKTPTIT
jgi:hypothetical protein